MRPLTSPLRVTSLLPVRAGVPVVLAAVLLAACGTGGEYEPTALPTSASSSAAGPTPSGSASPSPSVTCSGDVTASYDPVPSLAAGRQLAGVKKIAQDGTLTVGVSADTRLLGARNPETNVIEGFDIDAARAVAEALFGDPSKVTLRVITAADRIPLLASGEVELVARNMTITCERWQQIAFSGVYYLAGQRVLVAANSPATSIADLPKGARVCAPRGSTSLAKLKDYPALVPVASDTHTGCLVLLQQGQADAITGDDTVLAGLVAQDPYTKVVGPKFTQEPYGLGVAATNREFVRFVNAALDDYRADGGWQASYNRWLAGPLGAATPPRPVYGRSGPTG